MLPFVICCVVLLGSLLPRGPTMAIVLLDKFKTKVTWGKNGCFHLGVFFFHRPGKVSQKLPSELSVLFYWSKLPVLLTKPLIGKGNGNCHIDLDQSILTLVLSTFFSYLFWKKLFPSSLLILCCSSDR